MATMLHVISFTISFYVLARGMEMFIEAGEKGVIIRRIFAALAFVVAVIAIVATIDNMVSTARSADQFQMPF